MPWARRSPLPRQPVRGHVEGERNRKRDRLTVLSGQRVPVRMSSGRGRSGNPLDDVSAVLCGLATGLAQKFHHNPLHWHCVCVRLRRAMPAALRPQRLPARGPLFSTQQRRAPGVGIRPDERQPPPAFRGRVRHGAVGEAGAETGRDGRVPVPHAEPELARLQRTDVQRVRPAGVQMGVGQQLRGEQLGRGGEFRRARRRPVRTAGWSGRSPVSVDRARGGGCRTRAGIRWTWKSPISEVSWANANSCPVACRPVDRCASGRGACN